VTGSTVRRVAAVAAGAWLVPQFLRAARGASVWRPPRCPLRSACGMSTPSRCSADSDAQHCCVACCSRSHARIRGIMLALYAFDVWACDAPRWCVSSNPQPLLSRMGDAGGPEHWEITGAVACSQLHRAGIIVGVAPCRTADVACGRSVAVATSRPHAIDVILVLALGCPACRWQASSTSWT
jgi:hypothetical protein